MNFVTVIKMTLAASFVAVTLLGQPFAAQANELVAEPEVSEAAYIQFYGVDGEVERPAGGCFCGGDILVLDILDSLETSDRLATKTEVSEAAYIKFDGVDGEVVERPAGGGGGDILVFDIVDCPCY
jgi:hypothetical protein